MASEREAVVKAFLRSLAQRTALGVMSGLTELRLTLDSWILQP